MNTPQEHLTPFQREHQRRTRAQIVRQYQEALNALAKVVDLVDEVTTENLGSSEWFCNGYPFGQDLDTVVYQFANYITKLKGN